MGTISIVSGPSPFSSVMEIDMVTRNIYKKAKTPERERANYIGGRPRDESRMSTNPRQIRLRLRRMVETGKDDTQAFDRDLVRAGYKPIAEWDFEELAYGRPKKNGKLMPRPISYFPQFRIEEEIKRRLHGKSYERIVTMMPLALEAMQKLLVSTEVDDNGKPVVDARTKLAAATYVLDRVMGKTAQAVEITAKEDTVKNALAPAIVLDDGLPQGHLNVIEGDVVEDDDEEWEDDDE